MKYSGDTPAKKVARLVAWKRAKELARSRFLTGQHLVLLSAEAGDVATLRGCGVHVSKIVGVDIDKHAIASARRKYPELECVHDDIAAVTREVAKRKTPIATVLLDFCGPLSDATVGKAIEVSEHLPHGAVLMMVTKMGRERGRWADAVNAAKSTAPPASRVFYLRTDLITRELVLGCAPLGRRFAPDCYYRYSSERMTGESSHMLLTIGVVSKERVKAPKRAAADASRRTTYGSIVANHYTVGALASVLAQREEDARLLLNLESDGSVYAYQAHRTRGTYKGVRSAVTRHDAAKLRALRGGAIPLVSPRSDETK